jgi:hypothetical protein
MKKPAWLAYLKRGLRQGTWPALQRFVVGEKIRDLAPVRLNTSSEICAHVSLCEAHATMLHWMLRSLLHHAKAPFGVTIHDDGSCSAKTQIELQEKFPGLEFIARSEARKLIPPLLKEYPLLHEWWPKNERSINAKWLDAYLLGKSRFVVFVDPDVLFFGNPVEVFEENPQTVWMRDCCYMLEIDPEDSVRLFGGYPLPELNTGLGRIERSRFRPELAERLLQVLKKPRDDMTLHAVMTAQRNDFTLLPSKYKIATELGLEGVVAKHYTNPYRFWFYEEGIPRVSRDLGLPLSRWLRERP